MDIYPLRIFCAFCWPYIIIENGTKCTTISSSDTTVKFSPAISSVTSSRTNSSSPLLTLDWFSSTVLYWFFYLPPFCVYRMAALTAASTQPYPVDGVMAAFGAGGAEAGIPGKQQANAKPKGFVASVLTSNRAMFIFSEENFIRRCAKWITEWPYPFLYKI